MPKTPHASQRRHSPLRQSLTLVALVMLIGTCGYMVIEGWSVWRSFFFTMITLTTVGYGDYGLTEAGEQFTVVLMVVGIGLLTYSMSQAVLAFTRYQQGWERRMQRHIDLLNGHYLVAGLGRMGIEGMLRSDFPDQASSAKSVGGLRFRQSPKCME